MRVLLLHQMGILFFQLVNDQNALGSVAKFDQSLQNATSIVLVAELLILLSDSIDTFLYYGVFLFARHFLLFHQETIV